MVNIVVSGYCGRMGARIAYLADKNSDIKIIGGIESTEHPGLGKDLGQLIGIDDLGVLLTDDINTAIKKPCVLVEFTNPEVTISHLNTLRQNDVNMVIGTTGLSKEDMDKINDASRDIAIVASVNMSVGVNLLFDLVEVLAKKISHEANIEIIETHHKFKKDAPSGTAKRIADIISNVKNENLNDIAVYGRQGNTGDRPDNQIGIHAVRTSDVVGEHNVIFGLGGERLELTHKAHSRDTFALGALKAAKFISSKKEGLYSMKDVLGEGC